MRTRSGWQMVVAWGATTTSRICAHTGGKGRNEDPSQRLPARDCQAAERQAQGENVGGIQDPGNPAAWLHASCLHTAELQAWCAGDGLNSAYTVLRIVEKMKKHVIQNDLLDEQNLPCEGQAGAGPGMGAHLDLGYVDVIDLVTRRRGGALRERADWDL